MGWWQDIFGGDTSEQRDELKQVNKQTKDELTQSRGEIQGDIRRYKVGRKADDQKYDTQVDYGVGKLNEEDIGMEKYYGDVEKEANDQATDAQNNYSNLVQPKMKANMESAMSLADAQNPDNNVSRGWRKQGIADYGVLAGMGAQATQQGMAGTPMTSGQQAAMQGQNMAQAGNAYWQNVNKGADETKWAYDAGQRALQNFNIAEGDAQNRFSNFRKERAGIREAASGRRTSRTQRRMDVGKGRYERSQGQGREDLGFETGMTGMKREDISGGAGAERQGILADMGAKQSEAAGNQQAFSTILGILGQGAAAYASGGASAAPAAAGAASQAAAPTNTYVAPTADGYGLGANTSLPAPYQQPYYQPMIGQQQPVYDPRMQPRRPYSPV
jgi:hypothetical protein